MGFFLAVGSGVCQSFNWKGRSSRSEFWWYFLFYLLCYFLCIMLFAIEIPAVMACGAVLMVELVVSFTGAQVRRLHDTGRSGGWWFISLIPIAGLLVLLVFYCQLSVPGINR